MGVLDKFSLRERFAALTILLTINWIPISRYVLGFDYNCRTPLVLICISIIILYKNIMGFVTKTPFKQYLCIAIFMFLNVSIKGFEGFDGNIEACFNEIFFAMFIMWFVKCLAEKDFDATLKLLVISFYLYTIFIIRDIMNGMIDDIHVSEYINNNTMAMNVLFTNILLMLLCLRKQISTIVLVFLMVLPVYAMLNTLSRMGTISLFLAIVGFVIFRKQLTFKNSIILFVLGLVVLVGVNYVLESTAVGARIMGTSEQADKYTDYKTGTFLDLLGDRGPQYYLSWPFFLENIWTGIGLRRWSVYGPFGLICHSEYLAQYLENGIISFLTYVYFFSWYLIRFFKASSWTSEYNVSVGTARYVFVILCIMVLMNFVLWSHDAFGYFSIFAIGYVFLTKCKNPQSEHYLY